jgi:predicted dehydrogenase
VNVVNWFFGAVPKTVSGTGGLLRFMDGSREVYDHVYATFEYPDGRTATFSSIESNAFDDYYEAFFGTKGTLVMYNENEALLYDEGSTAPATTVEMSRTQGGAAIDASETRPASSGAAQRSAPGSGPDAERASAGELEISAFCSAIRTGQPVACGPERAFDSAQACIAAVEALTRQAKVPIVKTT